MKKNIYPLPVNDLANLLKKNGFTIEQRNNFSVKGVVVCYEKGAYEITPIKKSQNSELKLVIPTKIRLFYGFLITVFASILISLFIDGWVVFGFIFFLFSTYIVDFFYRLKNKQTTKNLNNTLEQLFCQQSQLV